MSGAGCGDLAKGQGPAMTRINAPAVACASLFQMRSLLVSWAWIAALAGSAPVAEVSPPSPFTPEEDSLATAALAELTGHPPAEVGKLTGGGLRSALLDAARAELGQRLRPSAVDREWAIQAPRRDVDAEFERARRDHRLSTWLSNLSPATGRYEALRQARRRYAQIVDAGGWSAVSPGPTLRMGDRSPRIGELRSRLAVEGSPPPAEQDPMLFDAPLTQALASFQRLHSLAADGVLGPATRAALNVPAEARLEQIEANLERWRWLPRPLPEKRFEVDIGGAVATLYVDNRPSLEMRTIVGDRTHHTPMFVSRIEAVIFNPPWNVPASIAAKEILPRARREPGYLARNGFSYQGGQLRQAPGEKNALGVIKFDLPSPFGVYLHDTPGKAAFQRMDRALSHGCMRLEKPRELAAQLLAPEGGSRDIVEAMIATGQTQRVSLKGPVPLFVVYWTAVATPTGDIEFRPDTYGWDHKLTLALRPSGPCEAASTTMDTECSG